MKKYFLISFCMFINFFSAHAGKIEEDYKTTYISYIQKIADTSVDIIVSNGTYHVRSSNWVYEKRYHHIKKILDTLEISKKSEDIDKIFKTYGVIQNRDLGNDTLIIACGNLPSFDKSILVKHIDDYFGSYYGEEDAQHYRNNHKHENCDTIDPDFARNPTIVGHFGLTDLTGLFGNHKYNNIIVEGQSLLSHSGYPYAEQNLIALCSKKDKH